MSTRRETRVDYLEGGSTIAEFLEDFPTVERRRVEAFLDLALSGADARRERDARPAR